MEVEKNNRHKAHRRALSSVIFTYPQEPPTTTVPKQRRREDGKSNKTRFLFVILFFIHLKFFYFSYLNFKTLFLFSFSNYNMSHASTYTQSWFEEKC